MSEGESFDVLIIGAGQAAIPLAHALAKVGKRVGLAEREHLGGSSGWQAIYEVVRCLHTRPGTIIGY